MTGAQLSLQNIHKVYYPTGANPGASAVVVLEGFSATFLSSELCVFYGPNGAGKSTLFRIASKLEAPTSGDVHWRPAGGTVSNVWQSFAESLFPWLTVAENIALRAIIAKDSKTSWQALAEAAMRSLGVHLPLDKHAGQLSGGQMQMVALARALASEPDFAFFDEPFAALDEKHRHICMVNVRRWLRARHTCGLFVSHDLDEAILLADRLIVLSGSPMRILEDIPVALPTERTRQLATTPAFMEIRTRALIASETWVH